MCGAPGERDAITNLHPHGFRQPFTDEDHIPVIGRQESPGLDILRSNIRLRFLLGFDADDAHRESPFRAGDQAAGVDAARGYLNQRAGFSSLHHCLIIFQRQQRGLVGLLLVTRRMDLDVTSQDLDGIAINRLVKTNDQAIVHHHHGQMSGLWPG